MAHTEYRYASVCQMMVFLASETKENWKNNRVLSEYNKSGKKGRILRNCIQKITGCVFLCCVALWCAICYYENVMPDRYTVTEGQSLTLTGGLEAKETTNEGAAAVSAVSGNMYHSFIKLFGVFPVKEVTVNVVKEPVVVVAGVPFGIKMYTDGVLVVGFSDVDTAAGPCNPARIAGLKVGDVVLKVDGQAVSTNDRLRMLIEQTGGETVDLLVRRDNLTFSVKYRAVLSITENRYRSGFWVRDSSAGVGILTFFDPNTKTFGGLGHAVCDVDTGEKLPISTGEIVAAEVVDVEKGKAGTAGSLDGVVYDSTLGFLSVNAETGVYGRLSHFPKTAFETVPVAMKQQVKEGKAQILTTVEGTAPQYYDIEIVKIRYGDASPTKNMVVKITDPVLLQKAGGIVQGMSGSPIIQDGKLVGAVTHVLVNDPTKGYAIFAENMLETAKTVGQGMAPAA